MAAVLVGSTHSWKSARVPCRRHLYSKRLLSWAFRCVSSARAVEPADVCPLAVRELEVQLWAEPACGGARVSPYVVISRSSFFLICRPRLCPFLCASDVPTLFISGRTVVTFAWLPVAVVWGCVFLAPSLLRPRRFGPILSVAVFSCALFRFFERVICL